jgi:tyrosinase
MFPGGFGASSGIMTSPEKFQRGGEKDTFSAASTSFFSPRVQRRCGDQQVNLPFKKNMQNEIRSLFRPTRRQFLKTTGAAALASGLVFGETFAQAPAAKYKRMNLADPQTKGMLDSYKKAIAAMLKLPPTDPRNWYRNAFVHTFDCPHGNWWFLPWHRGYLGWFEQTCRELSGDPKFALPYWDWTTLQRVPDSFFEGVLNPSNPAYVSSLTAFQDQFSKPMEDYWKSLSTDQLKELTLRGYNSMDDVWAEVKKNPMFFPPRQARNLTRRDPDFDETTQRAVSPDTIADALAPADFLNFGSAKAVFHSQMSAFDILEGQPHNNVHNNVGGFMGDFLSPVDPLFFMHHSNIDRLWDVWTRKQQSMGLPTLPTGSDLETWKIEPFLFYMDSAGKPAAKKTAGDYATIGDFNYDYQPGSGETMMSTSVKPAIGATVKLSEGTLTNNKLGFSRAARADVALPENALVANATPARLFTRVTFTPPSRTRGIRFHVVVNPPEGATHVDFHSPSYAGTFEFFGGHQHADHMAKPVSFRIALSDTVKKLRDANMLVANEPLRVHVVAASQGIALAVAPVDSVISSIAVGTF